MNRSGCSLARRGLQLVSGLRPVGLCDLRQQVGDLLVMPSGGVLVAQGGLWCGVSQAGADVGAPATSRRPAPAPGNTCAASEFRSASSFDLLQRPTDTLGVLRCPAVGRCHRHPTVELSVAVVVAMAGGHRGGVGDVETDLPERHDRVPHAVDAVRPRPGGSPASPAVNSQVRRPQTTASDACCKNSTRVPSHGGAATAAMSSPWENRTVRPLSYRGSTSGVPGSRRTVNL